MQYGCIGEHLGHSFSAEIHALLADYKYEICEVARESLDDFMSGFLVGTGQNVLAMSPKNDVPQILSSEESRLIMLYRNSVRKAQILKAVEDIYCEDSEIVDDIKEN